MDAMSLRVRRGRIHICDARVWQEAWVIGSIGLVTCYGMHEKELIHSLTASLHGISCSLSRHQSCSPVSDELD